MDFKITTNAAGINQALFQVTHGLYILTSAIPGKINGQCLDALMQVTSVPPRIAICVGKSRLTHEMIAKSGLFAVNALDRECSACMDTIRLFGFQTGRKVDKFAALKHDQGTNGCPILPDAKAFYECSVIPEMTLDFKTHTLFVGLVGRAGTHDAGEPLTYNEYRKIKGVPKK